MNNHTKKNGRHFCLVLNLLVLMALTSCTREAKVTGRIEGFQGGEVSLMDAVKMDGTLLPVEVNADGTFEWFFPSDTAHIYYVIFSQPKSGFKLYVEPGLEADIKISFHEEEKDGIKAAVCDVDYQGDCKDAFEFLQRVSYFDAQNKVLELSSGNDWTFDRFRQTLRREVQKLEQEYASLGSRRFRRLMTDNYEGNFVQSLFWFPDVSNRKDEAFIEFMNSLDRENNMLYAKLYASAWRDHYVEGDGNVGIFHQLPTLFKNRETMYAVADQQMTSILGKMPANLDEVFAAYRELCGDREMPSAVVSAYRQAHAISIGVKDFEMQDVEGNTVRLGDMHGKMVYLDVWATWCGPCRAEIPYMEKLYALYKGSSDMVLVSVSIDSDHEAWKAKVTADNPGWPQYIVEGGHESVFCRQYGITGIPRFLLFDKEGRLVDANAPRPSDTHIVQWLDEHIKP